MAAATPDPNKPKKKKTVSRVKKEVTEYSRSLDGDTTRIKYPPKVSSNGLQSQVTKVLVKKRKKV